MSRSVYLLFTLLVLPYVLGIEWNYGECADPNCLNNKECVNNFRMCKCVPAKVLETLKSSTDRNTPEFAWTLCDYAEFRMSIPDISCCKGRKRTTKLRLKTLEDRLLGRPDDNLKGVMTNMKYGELRSLDNALDTLLKKDTLKVIDDLLEDLKRQDEIRRGNKLRH